MPNFGPFITPVEKLEVVTGYARANEGELIYFTDLRTMRTKTFLLPNKDIAQTVVEIVRRIF